jgi:hypothetical protein
MLVDKSVLIRTLQPQHPLYITADRALRLLPEQGRQLHVVARNFIELWVVATRPVKENGLGMASNLVTITIAPQGFRDISF